MSSNALLWPSQGTIIERRLDKYKWLKLPSQGIGNIVSALDVMAYESGDWFDLNFNQRISKTINVGQVPSPLTDFKLLINDTFPELIGRSLNELRFASTDKIQLEYDIDEFDTVTGKLIVWINKSLVSDSDIIYIYFDNPLAVDEQNSAAVWGSNAIVIHHMNELSGNLIDSSENSNTMIPVGSPLNIAGTIGNAKSMDTEFDGYTRTNNSTFNTLDITVSLWVEVHTSISFSESRIVSKNVNPMPLDWAFTIVLGNILHMQLGNNVDVPNIELSPDMLVGVKRHIAFTIIGTTLNTYFDGDLFHTQTIVDKPFGTTSPFEIGALNGVEAASVNTDEVHVYNVGQSVDWIKTEYNNQRPTGNTFYTTGVVELAPPGKMEYEPENWLDPQLQKRTPFQVNPGEIPSPLTDFPVKVEGTIPALIGKTKDELQFASTDDIRLPHEIEEFDTVTGDFIAYTKKPVLADNDIIFAYYDNVFTPVNIEDSAAVFSNNFIVVHHMAELSGNIIDSSPFGNDMSPIGSPVNTTAFIGNAKDFPVPGDGYIIPANVSLNTTSITVSASIVSATASLTRAIIGKWKNPNDEDWIFLLAFNALAVILRNDSALFIGTILNNVLYRVAFTIDGLTLKMFIDGDLVNTQTITAKQASTTSRLAIASSENGSSSPLDGAVDELRITNDGKSDDWIKAESNNLRIDGNTFFTQGAEESIPILDKMRYELND